MRLPALGLVAWVAWPVMTHSCTASDGAIADPAVRIAAWARSFGANGLFVPICSDSFAPSFDRIGQLLSTLGAAP